MILIFILSIFFEYNFSPSLLSGSKFSTYKRAISLVHAPSISDVEDKSFMFSFSYSNPYAIPGFNFFEGAVLKNFGRGYSGAGYTYMGTDFYKEISYILGFSFTKEKINAGINLKYLYLYIKDTVTGGTLSFDFGISFTPLECLKIGAFFLNFNSPILFSEKICASGFLSFWIKENEFLETLFDLNYEGRFTSFSFAQRFRIFKNMIFSAGISNEPPLFSTSFEISLDEINFLYSFKNHSLLGGFNSYEIDFKR